MSRINDRYRYEISPLCDEKAIVKGEKFRFSILTPTLIRMEYSENGIFEDRATKAVINRKFTVPEFEVIEEDGLLKIITSRLMITYHKNRPFSPSNLTARYFGEWGDNTNTWRFEEDETPYGNEPQTYFGTLPSLDIMGGPVPLEKGFMSWHFTDWDDSRSPIIADDGWVDERPEGTVDTYLFAYREKHIECLHDFLQLSGKIPMLPRYALGNWWSRYYKYTDEEYLSLMDKFAEKGIPLSVAVLDMDWHITKIDKKYGTGWTGYTWNKELFPDPKEFLSKLHQKGLEVTVNLHDREGVAPHEENYVPMASKLGVESGKKVEFDFCSPEFVEAYFEYTHHGNEEKGITFWWVDGFPKNTGAIEQADIPWMLNHYHCVDKMRNGERAMLLSRNCGVGGHRYGVGFSGDTYATWEMLDFLPYFTSTAANVGFGWWSHDVGGFMNGIRDDEMMVRWEQFSVFSPINRLHSSDNPFMSKEPWKFCENAERVITRFMRLRHELIPYIYTMNYHCYKDNITLIRPLYYYCSRHDIKNEYFFGDDIIVSPITSKLDPVTLMGHSKVYLTKGLWFDYFTSRAYIGDRDYNVYRDINTIPVFVKAGGIIPQAVLNGTNDISTPKHLKIDIFPGKDNTFELYEDDGITLNYKKGDYATTSLELKWSGTPKFVISKPQGNLSLVPKKRDYTLCFRKITDCEHITVKENGRPIEFEKSYDGTVLILYLENISGEVIVEFKDEVSILKNDYKTEIDALLMKMQMSNIEKWDISRLMHKTYSPAAVLAKISADECDENLKNAVIELLTADIE